MADTTGMLDDVMIDPVTGEIIDQKGPRGAVARAGEGTGREFDGSGRAAEPTHEECARDGVER